MADMLLVRRDVDFLLHDWLRIGERFDRQMVDSVLDLSERLAEQSFLPHYKGGDIEEPRLDADGAHIYPPIAEALRQYGELGLFAAGFPENLGGLGLPFAACSASYAYFAAANIAAAGYTMLTVANARLIATFGTEVQVARFALPQIEGRWFGTMCLSEPQAGSSLGDIRTRAEPAGDDEFGASYRLTGNKMWISGGDQDASENIIHLVLAKIPDDSGALPPGTEGISLFIVPKILPDGRRNDVTVAGLNHKMGFRGTTNCLLNFGEGGGATGWRVGEPGRGLRQMFLMMNEARVQVGTGAAALGYRSYRLAAQYARERAQGRPTGVRGGGPVAIIEHADVRRMLLTQKAYAEGALALCLYCAALVDQESDVEAQALLALLTPVAKTWPSEYGLLANDLAIQIHGGYGYTRDFDVEQLWRDNRLNPIHEGTTGIQGIDLVSRKMLGSDGTGMAVLEKRIRNAAADSADRKELSAYGDALLRSFDHLKQTIAILADGADPIANATTLLWAFGHVVVAWLWLEQATAASGLTDQPDFTAGKIRACRFFFEGELPKSKAWLDFVQSCSDVCAAAPADIF